ncbi:hypothetical protein [Dongia sp.]|jgi:hypothetical protein|uniref:hypothetical protein n=1 Tax=Dongia sp. TaxID=1977262 RepID=UPI0035AFE4C8
MPIKLDRESKLPTWQFALRMAGALFFGGIIIFAAFHSFVETTGSVLLSAAATLLLSLGILGIPFAIYSIRFGHRDSDKLLLSGATGMSIPFNRRPDAILTISFLAVVPELIIWTNTDLDQAGLIFLWCLVGLCLSLVGMAFWSWLAARSPLLIDRDGLQMPDLWSGTLLWRDIEAVFAAGDRIALACRKRPDIALKKRAWYNETARWATDEQLLLIRPPLRYLSLQSFVSLLRDKAGLKRAGSEVV